MGRLFRVAALPSNERLINNLVDSNVCGGRVVKAPFVNLDAPFSPFAAREINNAFVCQRVGACVV